MKFMQWLKKSIGWKENSKKNISEVKSNIELSSRLGNAIVRQSVVERVGVRDQE